MVNNLVNNFLNELILYGDQLLRRVKFGCGRELAFEVFLMVAIVDKAYVDSDLELGLCGIAIGGYRLVKLRVFCDFARQLEVAVALENLELGLVAVGIGE